MKNLLTIDQTDEIIRNASSPADGAIEDCEVTETSVTYFFESGARGEVSPISGEVSIQRL